MVEAIPSDPNLSAPNENEEEEKQDENGEGTAVPSQPRALVISSDNFINMNEGNIKVFYKISSCIGRGKFLLNL